MYRLILKIMVIHIQVGWLLERDNRVVVKCVF